MKKMAEEKFKLINEAYEVLSNDEKRKIYDSSLKTSIISEEDYNAIINENQKLKNIIQELKNQTFQNNITNSYISPENPYIHSQKQTYYDNNYKEEIKKARQKAYHDAYIQDLKNRGYKIKYKKTPKDYLTNLISLVFTVLILFVLWQIPFIKNIFMDNIIFETLFNL